MQTIPHEKSLDSTLQLLNDPYCFIGRKSTELGSDVFQIRLLSKPFLCMTGEAAAKLFYNEKFFVRRGALPEVIRATFLGKGGVQTLDGKEHLKRKEAFMKIMSEDQVKNLTHKVQENLLAYANEWEKQKGNIKLYQEFKIILFETVCLWVGLPLSGKKPLKHAKHIAMMFEDAASPHKHLQLRIARSRTEKWIMKYVDEVRKKKLIPSEGSALEIFSNYHDVDNELLDTKTAAVEIINIIRPVMAVSVYLSKAIHALHTQPEARRYLLEGEDEQLDHFVQEVRRFYPFFPSPMAKVKDDFEWEGMNFKKGTRAMLDLYGTNRDPRIWNDPDEFIPARFADSKNNLFNFIPQGAGETSLTHRCPGILATTTLMKMVLKFFTEGMDYNLPLQSMDQDYTKPPALIKSGLLIKDVKINREYWRPGPEYTGFMSWRTPTGNQDSWDSR